MKKQDLSYLDSAVALYGTLYMRSDFDRFLSNLTDRDNLALSVALRQIAERNHTKTLRWWCDQAISEQLLLKPRLREDFPFRLSQLILLFDKLGDQGIFPFCDIRIEESQTDIIFDWSKLPPRLAYLSVPAESFKLFAEKQMRNGQAELLAADFGQFRELADAIATRGHIGDINEWLRTHPLFEHPEAAAIYELIGFMDNQGFTLDPKVAQPIVNI